MKKSFCKYTLILACGALFTGGCAKREIVKKDEAVAPAATAKSADASDTQPLPAEAGIKTQPVKEDTVADQMPQGFENAAKLESALERIFFDFDSYLLAPAARGKLTKNAEVMKKNGGARIRIEGHCDERGSDEYNLALGEKRARSAMQYLVTLGIAADRLSIISYGEEKPADSGHDKAAWAKNRRDEFVTVAR